MEYKAERRDYLFKDLIFTDICENLINNIYNRALFKYSMHVVTGEISVFSV